MREQSVEDFEALLNFEEANRNNRVTYHHFEKSGRSEKMKQMVVLKLKIICTRLHTFRLALLTHTLVAPDSRSKFFKVSVANSSSPPLITKPA